MLAAIERGEWVHHVRERAVVPIGTTAR